MVQARNLVLKNEDFKHILHIRCFMHAFRVTMESIMDHPQIKSVVALCQKIVAHIRASHYALAKLQQLGNESRPPISSGLQASITARLTSVFLCIESVLNYKKILQKMTSLEQINSDIVRLNGMYTLLKPFSDVIMSIQGNKSTLADVARY
jgi:hypothetical protein